MSRRHAASVDPTSRIALGFEGTGLLHAILDTLSEREATMIAMRYGLTDGKPKALNEISRHYGISRERVVQIITRGLAKLRHQSRRAVLGVWEEGTLVDIVSTGSFTRSHYRTASLTWCAQCNKVPVITPDEGEAPKGGRARKYCSNACRQAAYRTRKKHGG